MKRRVVVALVMVCVVVALVVVRWRRREAVRTSLPYRDGFAQHKVAEWTPYGGSWKLVGDTIVVNGNDSGTKLVTGSDAWTNYQMWADVELLGHTGYVQIAVRVSDASVGAEAIRGYLVGLRSPDAGLEITRAAGTLLSLAPVRLPGGVSPNTWYQLHVVAVGCAVVAEARNEATGQTTVAGFEDKAGTCLARGGIALRTTATSAAWRHVRVTQATEADVAAVAKGLTLASQPDFPLHEREYSAMREAYLATVPPEEIHRPASLGTFGAIERVESADLVGIGDLRSQLWNAGPVRIVGVVTSNAPLYLQDPTAGVRLEPVPGVEFRTGDEVEVIGRPTLDGSVVRFEPLAGRFLSDRVPVAALSVTATQAASGRYEGTLIEVNGTVRSSRTLPDGQLGVLLEDEAQRFTVRVPYNLFNVSAPKLEANSRVRVRGVCAVDRSNAADRGAFVLYATSRADVALLEGPPWWTGQRLLWILGGAFALIGGGILLYGIEERTKLRIVQEERERLSHDMHDTLAQSLAGVGFRLQGIHRSLQSSGVVPQVYVDDLKMTCELVAHTHREASSNIAALHPASQKDADVLRLLEKAVYSMLDDDEFPVIVSSHGTPRPLSPVVADTLYRVGREAIANALRHARARSIRVQLSYRSRDVVLSVTDDGVGFVFDPAKAGFGIKSMTRRCEGIKAKIAITSAPEGGCRVQVTSPYRVYRGLVRWVG
jgi:signal transduction histidine kinase